MPIIDTEMKLYKSAAVNDGATNGGRMSVSEITSGAMSNIFPAVGETERTDGSIKHRKVFPKVENDADLTLFFPKIYLDNYTPGDDMIRFFAGTQSDAQSAIGGSEKKYGCGKLDQNVSAAATEIDVLVEDGAANFFADGDTIRITSKADIDDSGGDEEYNVISGAPSVLGDVVTITLATPLANGYSASASRVMNVYEPDDIVASVSDVSVTSASGTFNDAFLFADNIGSVEDAITLTFTGATTFTIAGAVLGSLGSGNIGSGASPNNADFGKPFFVIQSAAFGGTFASSDTVEFDLHPASVGIWLRRDVPAGAANLTVNEAIIVLDGETSDA